MLEINAYKTDIEIKIVILLYISRIAYLVFYYVMLSVIFSYKQLI